MNMDDKIHSEKWKAVGQGQLGAEDRKEDNCVDEKQNSLITGAWGRGFLVYLNATKKFKK